MIYGAWSTAAACKVGRSSLMRDYSPGTRATMPGFEIPGPAPRTAVCIAGFYTTGTISSAYAGSPQVKAPGRGGRWGCWPDFKGGCD